MLNKYGFLLGDFKKSTPGWINGENAIWHQFSTNIWIIGSLSEIGSTLADIIKGTHFSGLIAIENQWLYHDENSWTSQSDPNDISVKCVYGKYILNTGRVYYYLCIKHTQESSNHCC